LPADASGWPDERRRMVLAHELAHIKRQDWPAQLLARVAFSLYWFHPLAWLAARQFTKERERACDDLVLSLGARPSDYAAQLLEVARSFSSPANTVWATVTMARRSQLEGRLLAVLDSNLRRGLMTRLGLIGTLLAAACFVVPLAAMRPGPAIPPLSPMLARIAPPAIALAAPAAQAAAPKPDEYRMVGQLCRLGIETQLAKEYAQAEGYYQRALALVYPESLEAARIYNYRGILFQNENRTTEAEHDFLSALAIEEKTSMGTSIANADRADTLQLYSGLLRDTGRADQAEIQARLSTSLRIGYLWSLAVKDLLRSKGSLRGWESLPHIGPKSEGWFAPVPIEKTEPEYSDLARLTKLQGTVALYVEIGTDGKVYTIHPSKTLGLGLDENAMDAVKTWRFEPALKGGRPVAVGATIEVNFRLL
jgi:TonB family protein